MTWIRDRASRTAGFVLALVALTTLVGCQPHDSQTYWHISGLDEARSAPSVAGGDITGGTVTVQVPFGAGDDGQEVLLAAPQTGPYDKKAEQWPVDRSRARRLSLAQSGPSYNHRMTARLNGLPDGDWVLWLTYRTQDGDERQTDQRRAVIDRTPPRLVFDRQPFQAGLNGCVEMTGHSEPLWSVRLADQPPRPPAGRSNDQSATPEEPFTVVLPIGEKATLHLVATDFAGNTSRTTVSVLPAPHRSRPPHPLPDRAPPGRSRPCTGLQPH